MSVAITIPEKKKRMNTATVITGKHQRVQSHMSAFKPGEVIGFWLALIKTLCLYAAVTQGSHGVRFFVLMFRDWGGALWLTLGGVVFVLNVSAFIAGTLPIRRFSTFFTAVYLFAVGVYGIVAVPFQPGGWENASMSFFVLGTFWVLMRKTDLNVSHRADTPRQQSPH